MHSTRAVLRLVQLCAEGCRGQRCSASHWLLAAFPKVASLAVVWVLIFTLVLHAMQGYTVSSSWHMGCLWGIELRWVPCIFASWDMWKTNLLFLYKTALAKRRSWHKCRAIPIVHELRGRLFVWISFYGNLRQCKCWYFLKRCSSTEKSTFCILCSFWVTSTGQAKYLCK